jgi:DNA polymerase
MTRMTRMTFPTATTPLTLDKRQRAMLKAMGIRVWSPLDAPAAAVAVPVPVPQPVHVALVATESVAEKSAETGAEAGFGVQNLPPNPAARVPADIGWQFDAAHALFAHMPPQPGPRWLVLAEASAAPAAPVATADPLAGDAGQLLGNMLRAARLAHPGRVVLVPLRRLSPAPIGTPTPSVSASPPTASTASQLTALIATHQPDLVLVMGRLAAQALLNTTEPLGKLRGRVHVLQGVPTVVTYDAQPLLRTPADKAKAWDDLCLAMATAATASAVAADQAEPGG